MTASTYTGLVGSGKTVHALAPYGRQWTVCGREPARVDGPTPREITCRRCLDIIAKGARYAA